MFVCSWEPACLFPIRNKVSMVTMRGPWWIASKQMMDYVLWGHVTRRYVEWPDVRVDLRESDDQLIVEGVDGADCHTLVDGLVQRLDVLAYVGLREDGCLIGMAVAVAVVVVVVVVVEVIVVVVVVVVVVGK